MGAWKDHPPEILNLVFTIITEDKDPYLLHPTFDSQEYILKQCQLTCKSWSEQAQKHLYRTVIIEEYHQFRKLFATLRSSTSNPGQYVKFISMCPWYDTDDEVPYSKLHQLVPNIEMIGIDSFNYIDISEGIREACKRGACRRLKDIEISGTMVSEKDYKRYIDIVYCLRGTFEKLILDEAFVVSPDVTARSLKEFPSLRSLIIKNIKCLETFYWIGKHTESCPDLASLQLTWPSGLHTNENTVTDLHALTPCPTVRFLNLELIPSTKEIVEYIMYAFPNLNHITLLM